MSTALAGPNGSGPDQTLKLRLFVAGDEANSRQARHNLTRLCEAHLEGNADIEIIDVLKDFRAAVAERILVTPELIVGSLPSRVVVFGNLSDTDQVLAALGVAVKP